MSSLRSTDDVVTSRFGCFNDMIGGSSQSLSLSVAYELTELQEATRSEYEAQLKGARWYSTDASGERIPSVGEFPQAWNPIFETPVEETEWHQS